MPCLAQALQEEANGGNVPEKEEVVEEEEAHEGMVLWHEGRKDTWHGRQSVILQLQ